MSEEITIDVGELYAGLHEQFSEQIPEYEESVRTELEEFIHNYNQQLERRVEESEEELALPEDGE